MSKYNDGKTEDNILQNQFTAYVVKAVKNRKNQYLKDKERREFMELLLESSEDDTDTRYSAEPLYEQDFLKNLSPLEQIEDYRLQQALKKSKSRDLYIFLAKALEDRSLAEISDELGISFSAATGAYYRMVQRLKRELGGSGK